jgi:hypothetical protein
MVKRETSFLSELKVAHGGLRLIEWERRKNGKGRQKREIYE